MADRFLNPRPSESGSMPEIQAYPDPRLMPQRGELVGSSTVREVIEFDKSGESYAIEVMMDPTKTTIDNIASQCLTIANYCRDYRIDAVIATASGPRWTFMPAEIGMKDKNRLSELESRIRTAPEVIIFDSGSPQYKDTEQLGIKDEWFPDGQYQYDVSAASDGYEGGVEVTRIKRARRNVIAEHAGSFTLSGLKVNPGEYEYTAPAVG